MEALQIATGTDLQLNFKKMSESHLQMRFSDNPEFQKNFVKTFSDLIFSQNDEMLEKLAKTKPNSLLNAVFKATEVGASFAKKEVSFIPYEIYKKEIKNGAEVKTKTGEYEALVIFDINFQKQQILRLPNCKRFFTAEVHEGVKVIKDLSSGLHVFVGDNDVTKQTVGYFAAFITTEGERYECYMSCAEIVDRAKFSPQYDERKYKQTNNSIHYEKIVVRNLIKEIPKLSTELKSIMSADEQFVLTAYEDVTEQTSRIEEAKKELAQTTEKTQQEQENIQDIKPIEAKNPPAPNNVDTKFF